MSLALLVVMMLFSGQPVPASADTAVPARFDLDTDAPVLIVLGQSNAVGYNAPITDPADKAQCGAFGHVKGLNRQNNRQVGAVQAVWTPYTCSGTNLGEEWNNGLGYSVATVTALRWERAVNAGAALPDLNVIHVAWPSQGMQQTDGAYNLWWPGRNPAQVDSLHPLAAKTISNGLRALQEAGKRPRVIGMHWNQWETEAWMNTTISASHVGQAFLNVLEPLRAAAGSAAYPIFLYRPRTTKYAPTPTQHVVDALADLTSRPAPNPYKLIDPAAATSASGAPLFTPSAAPTFGIFASDGVHYNRAVQEWFADRQWKAVFNQTNVALGRPATQSSTWGGASAALAVDGNTNGRFFSGSVTHTNSDANAWWQTDLGGVTPINNIKINSRTDGYRDRSNNAS
ncbi:galactose-binding domain-containing protein, partial [Streptomyces sp. BE303]|uniref:galactose-binding domain-containing protein n=1 Tax=Streptomyces sp. BE303 TaxID=3002528 RepID=UPI002E7626A4